MKLFIWTDEHSYTAFAHCDTVAEARDLLRPQIGGYDGSYPERAKARKNVEDFTPAVYNGRVADFRLSASAEEREATEYADKLSLQVTDLRAQLKASQADVRLLREALEEAADVIRRQGRDPGTYYPRNFDEKQVLAIAEHHGYGNLMALLASRWYDKVRGGAFSVGECVSTNASLARRLDAALTATAPKGEQGCQSKS